MNAERVQRWGVMTENEKFDKLNALSDNLFGGVQRNVLGIYSPPFEIMRPNIHESKKEFLEELKTVRAVRDHLNGILGLLVVLSDDGGENTSQEKDDDPTKGGDRKKYAPAHKKPKIGKCV